MELTLFSDAEALDSSLGVHTYIGCSIQDKGNLRLVSYLNPQQAKLKSHIACVRDQGVSITK